jgi:3'(2'), 5'-bisphosphate nucleotidase
MHVSRIDGSPLAYNQPSPYLPDLLICRPELADILLHAVAELAVHDQPDPTTNEEIRS